MSDKKFPSFDDALLKSLAKRVDDNRTDLISRYQQTLRETLFTNRSEIPPGELERVATEEADVFISSLRNSLSSARKRGMALSEMGLSREMLFGLLWALWEFFTLHFENEFAALNIYTSYRIMVLEGFLECYEKQILSEQEGIRKTFQIAFDHSMAKIRESEERYRALVEISPDMVALVDLNGNFMMVNEAGAKLFRYETSEEMIGKNILTFIAPEDHAVISDTFQMMLETGSGSKVEFLAIKKDSVVFNAEFNGSVIFDMNGNAQAVTIVGRDITLYKQTEQSLQEKVIQTTSELQRANERLNELLTRSPAILYAGGLERGCPITFISENVFEQLGYPAEQFTSDPDFVFNRVHPQDEERVRSETEHILVNEQMVMEYRVRHQNGEYRWVRDAVRLIRSDEGLPLEFVGSWVDITERKQEEEARRQAEEMLAEAQRISHLGSWTWDLTIDKIQFSDEMFRLVGMLPQDGAVTREVFAKYLPSTEAEQIFQQFLQSATYPFSGFEHQIVLPGGETRDVYSCVKVYCDENGTPLRLLGSTQDITERKRVEEALRESEERYRQLVDTSPNAISLSSLDGRLIFCNQQAAELYGYESVETALGQNVFDFIAPEDRSRALENMRQTLTIGRVQNIEYASLRRDGSRFPCELNASVLLDAAGQPAAFIGIVRDITRRKQAQEKLYESEARYRAVVEDQTELICRFYPDGRLTFVNDAYCHYFEVKRDDIIGRNFMPFIPMEDQGIVSKAISGLSPEKPVAVVEHRVIPPNGELRWQQWSNRALFDKTGQVRELQAVGRDITERKRIEQDLRIKDRALATAINAIIITTLDGKAVYVNDVHCSMFGYSRKEALQLNAVDLASDSVEAHQVIDSVQSQGFFAGESIAKRKDGSRFTVQISASLITSLEGQPIAMMASFVDITERRLIEEKLRESETRLRAIFENSLDGIVVTQDDKFVMCNKVFVQMLGVENPVELTGISATMFAAPDGQEAIAEHTRGIALGKSVPNFYEATARSKDGRLLPVEASISDYKIKDVHYTLGIVRNITERRQVEEKLRESEERFSTAFHASPVAQVISVLESGLFLDVNEAFSGLMGYTSDELIGHTSKELNLWMDFKDRQKTVKQLNLDGNMHNMEMQLVNRSGEPRIVLVSIALIVLGGKKCMISTLLDITERKQIESALRESEQRYRALAEAAYDMIFVIDRDDYITYVNSFASMQLGMQPDALIGQPRSRWFGKSDTDRMLNNLKQVFETGKPQYAESETVFTRGAVYLSTWLVPLRDERGVVAQVLGVSRDISELKKLERSLKKTNQQLEARVEKRTAALSDSHNRLRELTQQIVIAQEEERRRISRELHDEAGQALIGLRFGLDTIYRELPVNLRKIRRRMAKALAQTDQTIQWMRALAYNLRPPTLDLLGINLGIKELCREFSEQTGLKVEYSGANLDGLQDDIGISIYRFVQEALINVAKHAQAGEVQVTLEYQDEIIKASVQDNGSGIPDRKRYSGLGMVGIKERFDALGGRLEVTSVIPKGTRVQIRLPWKSTVK